MAWKVWAVSAKTWKREVEISPSTCGWARVLNGGSGGQATFELGDPVVSEVIGLYDLYPGQFLIVVEWDGSPVYAGFIEDHSYDYDTKKLTVSHKDIWSLWDDRRVLSDRSANLSKSKIVYTGLTLSTIAKRLVQVGTAGSGFGVPIVFPADVSGSSARTYYGYDLMTVGEALNELVEQENGPEIDFQPRWTSAGTLEWVMRVGSDLGGPMLEYEMGAADPGARGLWIKTDASALTTHAYGIGEGTEVDMLVRLSQSANIADYPARESTETFKDVKSGPQLQGLAQEYIRAHNQATRQAGMQVLAGGNHKANSIQLGADVRWNVRNDPYFTTGFRNWRIIQFSGDLGDWVTLEFQQKGG